MKIIKNKTALHDFLREIRKKRQEIALIPTMGSIHKGHLSLVRTCQKLKYFSLLTVFVNPTQFNDIKDFNAYPRDKYNDQKALEEINTDLLFFPAIEDLYPNGIESRKTIFEYRDILCDFYRPGHFDGVTTVVNSLINLIKPNHIFFGEKDFQQLKIIEKMLINNSSLTLHSCPSIRMSNGMSFSSRYKKFSTFDKKIFNDVANLLKQFIGKLKKNFNIAIIEDLKIKLKEYSIEKIDYVEIRNEINLLSSTSKRKSRLFVAFYIGQVRIIDNFIIY